MKFKDFICINTENNKAYRNAILHPATPAERSMRFVIFSLVCITILQNLIIPLFDKLFDKIDVACAKKKDPKSVHEECTQNEKDESITTVIDENFLKKSNDISMKSFEELSMDIGNLTYDEAQIAHKHTQPTSVSETTF